MKVELIAVVWVLFFQSVLYASSSNSRNLMYSVDVDFASGILQGEDIGPMRSSMADIEMGYKPAQGIGRTFSISMSGAEAVNENRLVRSRYNLGLIGFNLSYSIGRFYTNAGLYTGTFTQKERLNSYSPDSDCYSYSACYKSESSSGLVAARIGGGIFLYKSEALDLALIASRDEIFLDTSMDIEENQVKILHRESVGLKMSVRQFPELGRGEITLTAQDYIRLLDLTLDLIQIMAR